MSEVHVLTLVVAPLVQGTQARFTVTGATPGELVTVVAGAAPGNGPCPPALGGLCLGVVAPVVIGSGLADASGLAEVVARVPAAAPLVDLHVQAGHAGATPQLTAVDRAPILQDLAGRQLVVSDAATLHEALHTWRAGRLHFRPGNYARVVELPLEEAQIVHVERGIELSLPRTRSMNLVVDGVADAPVTLTADAWEVGQSLSVSNNTRAVTLHGTGPTSILDVMTVSNDAAVEVTLTSTVDVQNFQVADDAPLVVDLPALATVGTLSLHSTTTTGPELRVPSLTAVTVRLWIMDSPRLTSIDGWFPALELVEEIQLAHAPALTRIDTFGAPGLTLGWRGVWLHELASLETAEAFRGVYGPLSWIEENASMPNCYAADLLSSMGATNQGQCNCNLQDTCSDEPTDFCWFPAEGGRC